MTYPSGSLYPSGTLEPNGGDITATPYTDSNPCPRVEVLVSPMPAGAASVTLWRNYNGRQDVVRGADGMAVSGDALVEDYEAPFSVDVTYTVQPYDNTGTPIGIPTSSNTVNLAVTDAWAQDPLDPSTSMPWPLTRRSGDGSLSMKLGSVSGYGFNATQAAIEVLGSAYPVGQSNVRQAGSQVPIILDARTADQWNQIQALLAQALVVCLRLPIKVPLLDPILYVQFPTVVPAVDPNLQRVVWTLTGTQVRGPSLNVIVPVRTYADLDSEAATYAGLQARYATYLDAQRGN